ncbi:MAG: hypothetical protein A2Z25_04805 [Planctomycetes bacterium RBG_16_55_9]|nr:MAG: hypothetical protein A2Z25_04805 [Planctomycetes bacterium RBG_16_55_9]
MIQITESTELALKVQIQKIQKKEKILKFLQAFTEKTVFLSLRAHSAVLRAGSAKQSKIARF